MASHDTMNALIRILLGDGWTPDQVAQFKTRWSELGPNEPPICPGCFDDSATSAPLHAAGGDREAGSLVCKACGSEYRVAQK